MLYAALHTDDPTVAGTQDAFEAAYEGYRRVPVVMATSGKSERLMFPEARNGREDLYYFSVSECAEGPAPIKRLKNGRWFANRMPTGISIAPDATPYITIYLTGEV